MHTPLPRLFQHDAERLDFALAHSRYAARLAASDPPLLDETRARLSTPWRRDEMEAFLDAAGIVDEASLKAALRKLRRRVLLRLIARDLGGLADLAEVMQTATSLAETAITRAHRLLSGWLAESFGQPIGEDGGTPQELLVVGMGKLGGGELNVSSDIDLLFTYPEEGETDGARRLSNHEFFTRLGKALIAALGEVTADGFVFRVDMRLRPYGDSGPLVASFAMLEEYYASQGRAWERYAWIKGRVLCGARAEELTAFMRPFVFRKYLDFGAFAAIRELHAQIRREVARRDLADNIKLGPGGIREVEFAAQVFQLVRGGQLAELRIRPTLAVLAVLKARELLPAKSVDELAEAYVFLRNLEHRLQYLDDAQTQTLPQNDADRLLVAEAMGFDSHAAFAEALEYHRQRVTRHFEQIFAAPQSAQDTHPLMPLWQGALEAESARAALAELGYRAPGAVLERLARTRASSRYQQLPEASRARFDNLVPPLLEVAARQRDPDTTLQRILDLLEAIGRRSAYLALLTEYPQTLQQVARLLSASPWVSGYLASHPVLLDELLDARALQSTPPRAALAAQLRAQLDAAADDTERQMDVLRHFKQAQTFRLVAQDVSGALPLETLADRLSELADLILEEVIRLAWNTLRTRHCATPRFAVIAYGKLGGKELGYASDLDIIFLYADDHADAAENYARLGQRINTWLTSLTPAGTLYETDLRLRPDGAAGLLVSTLEAFARYQRESAWTWEHQALTRARFCAGDAAIGAAFEEIRRDILQQPRDTARLREEVLAMRQKMRDAHPNASGLFDLKHDRGGLIDVEFAVQYLVLAHSHQHPALCANAGNLALLERAAGLGLVPPDIALPARDAYRELRRRQHALRLQGADYARVPHDETAPLAHAVTRLWQNVFADEAP